MFPLSHIPFFLIDSHTGAGAAWRRAMADGGIVDRAMEANGYTINQNIGRGDIEYLPIDRPGGESRCLSLWPLCLLACARV
jgi:hypothetical protein